MRIVQRFLVLFVTVLQACGGSDAPSLATTQTASVAGTQAGASPFIAFVDVRVPDASKLKEVEFSVPTMDAGVSKPVSASYTLGYLNTNGYVYADRTGIRIPVFGLYADSTNGVALTLHFSDGSSRTLAADIKTAAFTGKSAFYQTPTVVKQRVSGDGLGFDFAVLKNGYDAPVVIDSDGKLRWARGATGTSTSAAVFGNTFVTGAAGSAITQYLLDGRINVSNHTEPRYYQFHHNIDIGPVGLLGEFDLLINGQKQIEFVVSEFDLSGRIIKEFDFADIISKHMLENGDDSTQFVRTPIDWFHMNATFYDASDRSIIASSRENFVIKVDYETKKILWILGDTTKYWYTFPSLKAKALTLTAGLPPIGQHAVSVTPDGHLQLFNNGFESANMPAGAAAGERREYSVASTYAIDVKAMTAREVRSFDYGKNVFSDICSSVYTEKDLSMLVNYSAASARLKTRVVGVNPAGQVAFDYEFPSPIPCQTSFNANVIRFERLRFE